MNLNLNHHQWKLVFNAVRKQQHRHLPDSNWYREHTIILNEIYDLAFSESYSALTEASKEDWEDFWESGGPEQSNNMY